MVSVEADKLRKQKYVTIDGFILYTLVKLRAWSTKMQTKELHELKVGVL